MIVISSGMPKSGSSYLFNIINDLLMTSGYQNSWNIVRKYRLNKFFGFIGTYTHNLGKVLIMFCLLISFRENTFAIKTHTELSKFIQLLLKLKLVKVVYIYRDPRDVLISATDHIKTMQKYNKTIYMWRDIEGFESALSYLKEWLKIYKTYFNKKRILMVKYEDLVCNTEETVFKVCSYMNLDVPKCKIEKILINYDRNNPAFNAKRINFNKGEIGRYKSVLNDSQLDIINREIGNHIKMMGY